MSTTPAPSPGPTSTHGASVGNRDRYARDDLYEQCSDHITEYMASSRWVGSRPSSSTTAASSSSVIPSCRCKGSVLMAPSLRRPWLRCVRTSSALMVSTPLWPTMRRSALSKMEAPDADQVEEKRDVRRAQGGARRRPQSRAHRRQLSGSTRRAQAQARSQAHLRFGEEAARSRRDRAQEVEWIDPSDVAPGTPRP